MRKIYIVSFTSSFGKGGSAELNSALHCQPIMWAIEKSTNSRHLKNNCGNLLCLGNFISMPQSTDNHIKSILFLLLNFTTTLQICKDYKTRVLKNELGIDQ